jgi:hypothetical protein
MRRRLLFTLLVVSLLTLALLGFVLRLVRPATA